ncbi:uncharacterized protein LAJ45_03040 [Morchella importuna]|uniref:uncharacterized protein n=1 Tax=Morchella importuna TaxID=1174673 RepID=UPI001E8DC832|nr:uncharacterized protein LAJ45_03040 [Morchella importuna]KAH8152814.1 hypothetical protein LAJ45_03040 [Morchella importuna]
MFASKNLDSRFICARVQHYSQGCGSSNLTTLQFWIAMRSCLWEFYYYSIHTFVAHSRNQQNLTVPPVHNDPSGEVPPLQFSDSG